MTGFPAAIQDTLEEGRVRRVVHEYPMTRFWPNWCQNQRGFCRGLVTQGQIDPFEAARSDKSDRICHFVTNPRDHWSGTLTWEDTDLFCSHCGKDVSEQDRFCSRCGNALSSAPGEDLSEMKAVDWHDTLDYRLVLHSPEVRRLVEDAVGTTKGGMTAEQFLKGVLPIVNVTGAKLAPVEFSAPRRRVTPVEEGSTQIIVDRSGS